MKKYFLLIILIVSSFLCFSCAKTELKAAWKKVEKIDYNESYSFNEALITEIRGDFERVQKANSKNWMCGYIQECQLLTVLYFWNLIEKDVMLSEIQNVYDSFFVKNSLNKKNTFSYAVLQYLKGNYAVSKKILEPIYKKNFKYNYTADTLSNADVKNFYAGLMLGEIDFNDFKGTIYEVCFEDFFKDDTFEKSFETRLIESLCATL